KIVGNDFSRKPRRGEAQGCVEQIGSGASPRSCDPPCLKSRPKPITQASNYVAFTHAKSKTLIAGVHLKRTP
ncbi:MAG: hypothetical protein P8015_15405, partial [Acidihalobacter sp.]